MYWVAVVVPEGRGHSTLRRRLSRAKPALEPGAALIKRPEVLSSIRALDALLMRLKVTRPLKELLGQSGVRMTVGTLVLLTTSSFLGTALIVQTYTRNWWLALAAAIVAGLVPVFVVSYLRKARINKFEEQFPEAIELIARAMRAGHAFATGLKMAMDEVPAPAGTEFKILHDQQNFGAQLPDALKAFAERIPSLDARFFVTAVLTQREAGGNLAEVLDRLAAVMRERFRIRREVRVRSAHGRMTAFVLAGMPPTIALLTMLNNPGQFKTLIGDPLGMRMIIVAVTLQIIGTLIVRKLVNIEY
jgi:tight adherence protein B